jgi:hypothetical protein
MEEGVVVRERWVGGSRESRDNVTKLQLRALQGSFYLCCKDV